MSRNVVFAPGEHYHVYNRGTEKRRIFSTRADYERFLALLYASNGTNPAHLQHQGTTLKELLSRDRGKQLVKIDAYCLMPNHFHLVLFEQEDFGISRFLQKLLTGYTMYFNKRNERSGTLFEGRAKARHANDDTYLRYLISYVHLNPVTQSEKGTKAPLSKSEIAAERYLNSYRFSSFLDFAGNEREEKVLLDRSALPEYFLEPKDFRTEIRDWLEYRELFEVRP